MENFAPSHWLKTPTRWLGLLVAFSALLLAAALVLEYGFGVLPCDMCWWQRYAHAAIFTCALVGLVGARGKSLRPYRLVPVAALLIMVAAAAGLAVAVWQFAAQNNLLPWPPGCTSSTNPALSGAQGLLAAMQNTHLVPCDKENFTILGLSLAAWNIPAMLAVLGISILGINKLPNT